MSAFGTYARFVSCIRLVSGLSMFSVVSNVYLHKLSLSSPVPANILRITAGIDINLHLMSVVTLVVTESEGWYIVVEFGFNRR